jgi:hypothetical protein
MQFHQVGENAQLGAIIQNFEERSKDIKAANQAIERVLKTPRVEQRRKRVNRNSPRKIHQGPKGGLYSFDENNKKVYLTSKQCGECENGELENISSGCPPLILGKCQPTKADLKRKLARSERKRKTLKRKLRTQSRRRKSCKEKLRKIRGRK